MGTFDQEQLKCELARDESTMDNIISITPIILVCMMFVLRQIVYDVSFCMQTPRPDYPVLFHIRRVAAFTRQTLLEIPYMHALFGLLMPSHDKHTNQVPCTVKDYGASVKKLPYWLLLVASVAVICFVPVLRISSPTAAWVYRIGFLIGGLLLFSIGYVVIRVAFHNKTNHTHISTHRNYTGVLTLVVVITVALTVLIHKIIVQ